MTIKNVEELDKYIERSIGFGFNTPIRFNFNRTFYIIGLGIQLYCKDNYFHIRGGKVKKVFYITPFTLVKYFNFKGKTYLIKSYKPSPPPHQPGMIVTEWAEVLFGPYY